MSRKIRITGQAETAGVYRVFIAKGLRLYSKSGLQLLFKIAKRFLQLDRLLPKELRNQVLRSKTIATFSLW
jgi:hypothetical protein